MQVLQKEKKSVHQEDIAKLKTTEKKLRRAVTNKGHFLQTEEHLSTQKKFYHKGVDIAVRNKRYENLERLRPRHRERKRKA